MTYEAMMRYPYTLKRMNSTQRDFLKVSKDQLIDRVYKKRSAYYEDKIFRCKSFKEAYDLSADALAYLLHKLFYHYAKQDRVSRFEKEEVPYNLSTSISKEGNHYVVSLKYQK